MQFRINATQSSVSLIHCLPRWYRAFGSPVTKYDFEWIDWIKLILAKSILKINWLSVWVEFKFNFRIKNF